jgi:hypothetical protein
VLIDFSMNWATRPIYFNPLLARENPQSPSAADLILTAVYYSVELWKALLVCILETFLIDRVFERRTVKYLSSELQDSPLFQCIYGAFYSFREKEQCCELI